MPKQLAVLHCVSTPFVSLDETHLSRFFVSKKYGSVPLNDEMRFVNSCYKRSGKDVYARVELHCTYDTFKRRYEQEEWDIVFLSMHGLQHGVLLFENNDGTPLMVSSDELCQFVASVTKNKKSWVFLSCCYSGTFMYKLAREIDGVVAVDETIAIGMDDAYDIFRALFKELINNGASLKDAFQTLLADKELAQGLIYYCGSDDTRWEVSDGQPIIEVNESSQGHDLNAESLNVSNRLLNDVFGFIENSSEKEVTATLYDPFNNNCLQVLKFCVNYTLSQLNSRFSDVEVVNVSDTTKVLKFNGRSITIRCAQQLLEEQSTLSYYFTYKGVALNQKVVVEFLQILVHHFPGRDGQAIYKLCALKYPASQEVLDLVLGDNKDATLDKLTRHCLITRRDEMYIPCSVLYYIGKQLPQAQEFITNVYFSLSRHSDPVIRRMNQYYFLKRTKKELEQSGIVQSIFASYSEEYQATLCRLSAQGDNNLLMKEFKRSEKIFSKLDQNYDDRVAEDRTQIIEHRSAMQREHRGLAFQEQDIDHLDAIYTSMVQDSTDQFIRAVMLLRLSEIKLRKMEKDAGKGLFEEARHIVENNQFYALYADVAGLEIPFSMGEESPLLIYASQKLQHKRLERYSVERLQSCRQLISTCLSVDLKSSAWIHAKEANKIVTKLDSKSDSSDHEKNTAENYRDKMRILLECLSPLVDFYEKQEDFVKLKCDTLEVRSQAWYEQHVKLCLILLNLGKYSKVESCYSIVSGGICAAEFIPDGKELIALYLSMMKAYIVQNRMSEAERMIKLAMSHSVDDTDYVSLRLELEQLYRMNGNYAKGFQILNMLENDLHLLSEEGKLYLETKLSGENRWGYYVHIVRKSRYNIYY